MKIVHLSIMPFLALAIPLAYGQKAASKTQRGPVETTLCKIFDDPSGHNNKLVKVRGYVDASSEYSLLLDEHCPEKQIWFAFADGSGPPQLQGYVIGYGTAGGKDSKRRPTPPIPVQLVRDESFAELVRYLKLSAKGAACADGPPPASPPDCTTYRVTATLTGLVDGVSKLIHAAHGRQSAGDQIDGKGFGHMGMFDAQIVVQSVENVFAVDESELRNTVTKPE
jgi:hypothetical protein